MSSDSPAAAPPPGAALPEVRPAPRWLAFAFVASSMALLPWTIWLYDSLPSRATADNWDVAWAGFDLALAATLFATAIGALRGATWTQGTAASAATLLVCDAWFDVMTSRGAHEVLVAVVMAGIVEAPLALVCVWVARNSERVSAWAKSTALRRGRAAANRRAAGGG
jgi:hypothetical protein